MQITNEKLYELCKKYGSAPKLWRQKFIGLLLPHAKNRPKPFITRKDSV